MQKKIIVGLGNPGKEYEHTYHNVGIMALDAIATDLEKDGEALVWNTHKHLFRAATVENVVLVAPLTFMNESGGAVREALKKYNALPADLIVLHDESDLAIGTYKISSDRSSAGHRGVQSIIDALGSQDFVRGRIGIRPASEAKRKKASAFVLAPISAADQKKIDGAIEEMTGKLTA
jgi:PTH1 family peptidyl-tRNA hydrolase